MMAGPNDGNLFSGNLSQSEYSIQKPQRNRKIFEEGEQIQAITNNIDRLENKQKLDFQTVRNRIRVLERTLNITRPNCALDRRTILCLYVPGFLRQIFKHVSKHKRMPLTKF